MGLYLRNNHYYFKRQLDKKAYYVALKLRRGQESLLSARIKQVEEEILAQHFGLPAPSKAPIGFADYCHKYLEQKTYKKTFDRDKQRLLKVVRVWGNHSLSIIGKPHVKKLEEELFRQGRKPATVNRYFELLSHLFNLAIEDKYLQENPCKYYQRFVEDYSRRVLTKPELTRILHVAAAMQKKPKNNIQSVIYDLILVGLNTGMRLSEILFLRQDYISKDVIVYPILQTKYRRRLDTTSNINKVKILYINNMVRNIISKYKTLYKNHPNPKLPLLPPLSPPIPPSKGLPLLSQKRKNVTRDMAAFSVTSRDIGYIFPIKWRNPNAIFRTVRLIRRRAKVPDFTFHQLRHTISTWVAARASLVTAKAILGHADIKTTLKYAKPMIEEQRRGVAKIEDDILAVLPK